MCWPLVTEIPWVARTLPVIAAGASKIANAALTSPAARTAAVTLTKAGDPLKKAIDVGDKFVRSATPGVQAAAGRALPGVAQTGARAAAQTGARAAARAAVKGTRSKQLLAAVRKMKLSKKPPVKSPNLRATCAKKPTRAGGKSSKQLFEESLAKAKELKRLRELSEKLKAWQRQMNLHKLQPLKYPNPGPQPS